MATPRDIADKLNEHYQQGHADASNRLVTGVQDGGQRIDMLKALREKLAYDLLMCSTRDTASIAKQLVDVDALITQLDAKSAAKGTPLDEFTKRLNAKQTSRDTGT